MRLNDNRKRLVNNVKQEGIFRTTAAPGVTQTNAGQPIHPLAGPQHAARPKAARISDVGETFIAFDLEESLHLNHDFYAELCSHGFGREDTTNGSNLHFPWTDVQINS